MSFNGAEMPIKTMIYLSRFPYLLVIGHNYQNLKIKVLIIFDKKAPLSSREVTPA